MRQASTNGNGLVHPPLEPTPPNRGEPADNARDSLQGRPRTPDAPDAEQRNAGAGAGKAAAARAIQGGARWLVLIGLVTAAIMEVLDTSIVNVALPQMAGNLGTTTDEIAWVATAYTLANVIILPMTAWLSGRFGRKRYLVFSIAVFIVASFFCGTSRSLGEIIVWRILQGAGGAALLSTAQATLFEIFPPSQQGMIQAVFGLGLVVAPTLAPALGGWLTDNYDWPWIFFINPPIGLLSLALVSSFLQDSAVPDTRASIDLPGIGLLVVGLGSMQYVLEEGNQLDWFDDAWITRLTILAGISILAFIAWELSPRNRAPVVNLRVLKDRGLSAGLIITLALGFGLYGGTFIYPLFVQNILGFSATSTGIVLILGGLVTGVGMILCGRIIGKGGDPRLLIALGMSVFIGSMWMLGHLTTQSGEPDTRVALILRGAGIGCLFIPLTVAALAGLKGAAIAQGSALFNLARQLGGSFGIAVLTTYITNMSQFHRVNLVRHIYSGSSALMDRQTALTQLLTAHGYGKPQADLAVNHLLDQTITVQATTQAYNDAFLLIGIAFAVAFPAIALLKKKQGSGGGDDSAAAMAH